MRRRFFFAVNAGAGLGHSSLATDAARALERTGASVDCVRPADFLAVSQMIREAVRSGGYDAVVAAGGDGTIRAAAAGLAGSKMPLGIVPCGTANVLAQEIGLKPAADAVAQMLRAGPSLPVACARANGEPFLLMVGAGFDARVVSALDQSLKTRVGKIAYVRPVLGALARPLDTLHVTIDSRSHDAKWVVVTNARHYAGRFVLTPRTGIRERGLEVILFRAKTRAALAAQLISLARGRLDVRAERRGDVEMHQCKDVRIAADPGVPVQVDGDAFGMTPLHIEAGTEVISLIIPGTPR